MADALPDHPFWTYSLQLYAQAGVTDACLKLQDEHGLDVNMVLFCIWSGLAGPGELTPEELKEAIERGGRWQTEVVERIRWIRRTLKEDPVGAEAEFAQQFRPRAQALELAAEHVEQLTLAGLVPLERGARNQTAAQSNLANYLTACGIDAGSQAHQLCQKILEKGCQTPVDNCDKQ